MIDPAGLPALPQLFSESRFDRYAAHYRGRIDLGLRLYAWNTELTTAFWGPISVLEIVVRNSMHDALRAGRRDDWWNEPSVRLMDRERRTIDDAIATLHRRGVLDPTPGDVVAATSFGFGVGLTDAGIPRHPTLSYETALWQPRLVKAFPGRGTIRRKALHAKLDDVRRFRNRLAHHEPIYAAPLALIRDDLIDIAGHVHPEAAEFIQGAHRVDEVIDRMRQAISSGECVI